MAVKKTALIQCGDHFENQARISSLAKHLRNLGYDVILMMYSLEASSRLFESLGFKTVYLNDYKDSPEVQLDGRMMHDITFIERERAPWKFYPARVVNENRKAVVCYSGLVKLLDELAPDLIGVWNGYTGYVANCLRNISKERSISHFYMERSAFDGALFVGRAGVNGFSEISGKSLASMQERVLRPGVKGVDSDVSSWARPAFLGSREYVFLPMQVQTDTNNILFSPTVKGMRRFVLAVVEALKIINQVYNKDYVLVVREHPEENDGNLNLPNCPGLFYCNDGSIAEWSEHSAAVVTINSTVGLEALCRGRPVISIGGSIYSGKGITIDSDLMGLEDSLRRVLLDGWKPKYDDVVSYLDELYLKYTADSINCPTCLLDGEPGSASAVVDGLDSLLDNLGSTVSLGIYCNRIPTVNLTYRKNKILLDSKVIRSIWGQFYNQEYDIVIRRVYSESDFSGFSMIMIPRSESDPQVIGRNKAQKFVDEYLIPYGL